MSDREVYQAVLAVVSVEQMRLVGDAKAAEHAFREAHFQAREQLPWKEWGSYMPYIRTIAAGVGCYWGKIAFHGPQGRRGMRIKEFGRKGTWRYTPSQFQDAKPWEVDAIEKAEEVFEQLRRRTAYLAKIVKVTKAAAAAEGMRLDGRAYNRATGTKEGAEGYRSVLDDWVPPSRFEGAPGQGE